MASCKPIEFGDIVAHILNDDAEPAAVNGAVLLQLTDDLLDERRRDREGNADTAAARREDRSVHADDLAVQIEGRAAGVAAINRRIDLQIVVGTRSDIAIMRRYDAGGHRAAEAERIADREHPIADARILVRELDMGERFRALDLKQRHIGAWIGADERSRIFVTIVERHRNILGVLNHVVIGDEIAVRRDKEAGALRHRRLRPLLLRTSAVLALTEMLEEVVERAVLRNVRQARNLQVVLRDLGVALNVDADNGRAHFLHKVGEAQRRDAIGGLDGLRRLGDSEAHVMAEREPQRAHGDQRSSRHRKWPAPKLPPARALFGHGTLVMMIYKVTSLLG